MKRECHDPNSSGAILFLVMGGKFSEGVDFKNELARIIVVLGLPLANFKGSNVQAKKKYLEKAKGKSWLNLSSFFVIKEIIYKLDETKIF